MIPKITNTITSILLFVSVLIVTTGFFISYKLSYHYWGDIIINTGFTIGQTVGLNMLIQGGTIKKTQFWRIIQLFFGMLLIGILFEALEWPYSKFLLVVPFTVITLTYVMRFITKQEKKQLDILKLLWILSACICLLLVKQYGMKKELLYASHMLFWLLILDFLILNKNVSIEDKKLPH